MSELNDKPSVLRDLILLVEEDAPTVEEIEEWSDEERAEVERWAAASHLGASDHDHINIPDKPEVLRDD